MKISENIPLIGMGIMGYTEIKKVEAKVEDLRFDTTIKLGYLTVIFLTNSVITWLILLS
jgi:hypothetical protein